MSEIESYLETLGPELKVLNRLFGFPESVWDKPERFVPQASEQNGLFRVVFEADGRRLFFEANPAADVFPVQPEPREQFSAAP